MEIFPRIVVDNHVAFGKPVIKGTRIPAVLILRKLAGGITFDEICTEYEITKEDILAVLNYAGKVLSEEEIKVAK